jgi:precorrin-6B methylase 2
LGLINWEELWKIHLLSTHRTDLVSYWDNRADGFNENTVLMQDLTQKQLDKLQLQPDYTVLDVGAGNGRLTIPIAKRVKQVTAIEYSKNMLEFLKSNAEKENIQNIFSVNCSFEDLVVGNDVHPHDVVVASFSLCMVDIANVLQKMDALAKKGVYLFVYASERLNEELQKIIQNDLSPLKLGDHIYVYNLLNDLGIFANIEIWDFEAKRCYSNVDDAVSNFEKTYNIAPNNKSKLRTKLNELLIEEKGKLLLKHPRKVAVIYWAKNH